MITELKVSLHLQGVDFSPQKLVDTLGWKLDTLVEKGDLAKHGRYKEDGYPTGSAKLKAPSNIDQFSHVEHLAQLIICSRKELDDLGVTDRYLYLGYFFQDQCNFEFTETETNLIAKAGLSIGISCYDVTDD